MATTLLASGPDFALLTNDWRIRREDVRAVTEAGALLSAAAARATAADRLASNAEARARQQGYVDGLAEGRAAGAAEAARAVAALAVEVRRHQTDQRERLGALSLDVVRRVAAELGPQAVLEAVVERAVRDVVADQPLAVHVPPESAGGVAERLSNLSEVEVLSDPHVASGEAVVVSAQGSAHAGLELQLALLERAFAELSDSDAGSAAVA
jgi:type III secretion protein L